MKIVLHRDDFADSRPEQPGFAPLSTLEADGAAVALVAFSTEETTELTVTVEEEERFQGEVLVNGRSIGFAFEGLSDSDELHLEFQSVHHLKARVVHGFSRPPNCRAICDDGTEGYPCVTCRVDDESVEVCC